MVVHSYITLMVKTLLAAETRLNEKGFSPGLLADASKEARAKAQEMFCSISAA